MVSPRLAVMPLLLAHLLGGRAQCPPNHPCAGGAHITVNPLRGLPPLPKPHFSWSIPSQYLSNDSVADGVVVDYVRITGGLSHNLADAASAHVAVQICAKAAKMPGAHPRAPSIGLNFGCIPGCYGVPADNSTCEGPGMDRFRASLRASADALATANREAGTSIVVGAVMIDCESDVWWANSSPAHVAGVTRRSELLHNATRDRRSTTGTSTTRRIARCSVRRCTGAPSSARLTARGSARLAASSSRARSMSGRGRASRQRIRTARATAWTTLSLTSKGRKSHVTRRLFLWQRADLD